MWLVWLTVQINAFRSSPCRAADHGNLVQQRVQLRPRLDPSMVCQPLQLGLERGYDCALGGVGPDSTRSHARLVGVRQGGGRAAAPQLEERPHRVRRLRLRREEARRPGEAAGQMDGHHHVRGAGVTDLRRTPRRRAPPPVRGRLGGGAAGGARPATRSRRDTSNRIFVSPPSNVAWGLRGEYGPGGEWLCDTHRITDLVMDRQNWMAAVGTYPVFGVAVRHVTKHTL